MRRSSNRAIAVRKMIWKGYDSQLLRLYGYKLASNEMIAHSSTDDKFLAICRFSDTEIIDGIPYDHIEKRVYIDKCGKKYDEKDFYNLRANRSAKCCII